jgi:hypothetical protein
VIDLCHSCDSKSQVKPKITGKAPNKHSGVTDSHEITGEKTEPPFPPNPWALTGLESSVEAPRVCRHLSYQDKELG